MLSSANTYTHARGDIKWNVKWKIFAQKRRWDRKKTSSNIGESCVLSKCSKKDENVNENWRKMEIGKIVTDSGEHLRCATFLWSGMRFLRSSSALILSFCWLPSNVIHFHSQNHDIQLRERIDFSVSPIARRIVRFYHMLHILSFP